MRVSQPVSPSAFPQFFWHRDSELSGVRLVPEPLVTVGLWKRIVDLNLALRKKLSTLLHRWAVCTLCIGVGNLNKEIE
jgi:hypothetical protein